MDGHSKHKEKLAMSAKKSAKKPKSQKKPKTGKSVIPSTIFAQASPISIGGVSMFEAQNQINSDTFVNFLSEADLINRTLSANVLDNG
jgi:hypothetical protein